MDCISILQQAIQFMEENLTEPITYQDVARHLNISGYHFHRIFSMVTGITAHEYLRNRRLSLAGQELITSNLKIIDLAVKYGYETADSFTKAFARFHGVTPSAARRRHTSLMLYNRLILKLSIEGGNMMNYRIEKREPFKVLAKVRAFPNTITGDSANHEIPDFWAASQQDGSEDKLRSFSPNSDLYGLCAHIDKEAEDFNYGIGVLTTEDTAPAGFTIWEVGTPLWAVFECYGEDAACIGETWDRIFKEFLPNSPYDMLDDVDFERYPLNGKAGLFCEVWIPVSPKTS